MKSIFGNQYKFISEGARNTFSTCFLKKVNFFFENTPLPLKTILDPPLQEIPPFKLPFINAKEHRPTSSKNSAFKYSPITFLDPDPNDVLSTETLNGRYAMSEGKNEPDSKLVRQWKRLTLERNDFQ